MKSSPYEDSTLIWWKYYDVEIVLSILRNCVGCVTQPYLHMFEQRSRSMISIMPRRHAETMLWKIISGWPTQPEPEQPCLCTLGLVLVWIVAQVRSQQQLLHKPMHPGLSFRSFDVDHILRVTNQILVSFWLHIDRSMLWDNVPGVCTQCQHSEHVNEDRRQQRTYELLRVSILRLIVKCWSKNQHHILSSGRLIVVGGKVPRNTGKCRTVKDCSSVRSSDLWWMIHEKMTRRWCPWKALEAGNGQQRERDQVKARADTTPVSTVFGFASIDTKLLIMVCLHCLLPISLPSFLTSLLGGLLLQTDIRASFPSNSIISKHWLSGVTYGRANFSGHFRWCSSRL